MTKKEIEQQIKRSGWASLTSKQKDYYTTAVEPTETATKEKKGVSEIIYEEAIRNLGRDISPTTGIYGCAESENTVVQNATGKPIGGGTSTRIMRIVILATPDRFKKINPPEIPERGTIILSATGTSMFKPTKKVPVNLIECGHVGIVSDDGKVMSNDSKTSLWKTNYTIKSWRNRWEIQGKYLVEFFRIMY